MNMKEEASPKGLRRLAWGLTIAALGMWLLLAFSLPLRAPHASEARFVVDSQGATTERPGKVGVAVAKRQIVIHERATDDSGVIGKAAEGEQLMTVSTSAGWTSVVWDGHLAWARSEELENTGLQLAVGAPSTAQRKAAERLVAEAHTWLGTEYVWGGQSKQGADCSGFIQTLFAKHGVKLPRTTGPQARVGFPVTLKELEPGDRLCFNYSDHVDHVGLYIGGHKFIHAFGSARRVVISSLLDPRFSHPFVGGRRDLLPSD